MLMGPVRVEGPVLIKYILHYCCKKKTLLNHEAYSVFHRSVIVLILEFS